MTLQMILGLVVVAVMIYLMAKRKDPKTLLFAAGMIMILLAGDLTGTFKAFSASMKQAKVFETIITSMGFAAVVKLCGADKHLVSLFASVLKARSTDNKEFDEILEKFAAPVAQIEKAYGVKIEYTPNVLYRTFKIDKEADIAQIAAKALEKMGIEVTFARGGGGMDGNHFNNHGIEAIGIAPGYFKNHTPDEHIYLDDLKKCGELAAQIVWNMVK